MGKARAACLKSLADCKQLVKYANFYQDFVASIHSDFFQEQTHRSLLYWPNHSENLGCPKTKSLKILLSEKIVFNSGSDVSMKNTYCLFQIKFITEYTNVQHIIITHI